MSNRSNIKIGGGEETLFNQEKLNDHLFLENKKNKEEIDTLKEQVRGANRISKSISEVTFGRVNNETGSVIKEGLIHKIADSQKQSNDFKKYKVDFITVGGIFVSIFTFISIEIQILKNVCDFYRIAGFSLIIVSSLSLFTLLIQYIGNQWIRDNDYRFPHKMFWSLCAFPFLLGLVLPWVGSKDSKNSCVIYEQGLNKIEDRIEDLEKKECPAIQSQVIQPIQSQNSPKMEEK